MLKFSGVPSQFTATYWRPLRYFGTYRVCLAGLLFVSSLFNSTSLSLVGTGQGSTILAVTVAYLWAAVASLVVVWTYERHFDRQLSLCVLVDVVVLTLLLHLGGGLRSGFGVMLLVMLAGAGLVGQGRLVLFYAAIATLFVLLEQSYRALHDNFELGDFFQAGLYCAGFFGVAISAQLLASRVVANEVLARRRGIDLRNQTKISQRVIEEMQDGILVLNRQGVVRQHNPRAEALLGMGTAEVMLAEYSGDLAQRFAEWCERPVEASVLVHASASGRQLRARFVETDSSEHDVLVFLEDIGRLQEQVRQLKLAALGRLTASIAHEIRNPLSAIQHAGELLGESVDDATGKRLLGIITDNTQRVERIVSDVLLIGRRDRLHRELIDLRQALPSFVEAHAQKERVDVAVFRFDISGRALLCFDRSHFDQVLWNLVSNALRYSQKRTGSICLRVRDALQPGWVDLHVIDDGKGVGAAQREHIFEPFFTTDSAGTGLGLYIARELCEANGAHLELGGSAVGGDFRVSGRANECQ